MPASTAPGSAATSIAENIVKPAEATGRTKCIECGDYECCCIPIPCPWATLHHEGTTSVASFENTSEACQFWTEVGWVD
ncbi:hypothetical protein jhhlp_003069 [Lomentospora prolificans]|uniref:Uncharacterized protein n=1 Tax=Lomentospora prolificans TaxID=41688 RepID=A0A2N3NFY6_9PEZI|nr:hypothetical protein jhhlp_003069 [Lomentospora prolificans]